MRAAAEVSYQENRTKARAAEAARRQWRNERERARRPMRCYYLSLARAAKRREVTGYTLAECRQKASDSAAFSEHPATLGYGPNSEDRR